MRGGRGELWRHVRPKSSVSHRRGEGQRPFSPCELERCAEFSDPVSKKFFTRVFKTSALPIECQEPAALRPDGWRRCQIKSCLVIVCHLCVTARY